MWHKTALITALALPASAAAHSAPHIGMGLSEGIAFMLGLGMAGVLFAALQFPVRLRPRRTHDRCRRVGIDRKEPQV